MALQGTLETFSVPEVLRLLSSTKKTGLLALDGDRGVGNVWLSDGSIVAARSDHEPRGEVDAVLFDLLRYETGAFLFEPGAEPVEAGAPVKVESALGRAETMLTEWRELEKIVPSMGIGVRLVRELSGESVTVTAELWRSLAAIGGGTTVAGLGERLELGELDTCRRVRDLVDATLVEITEDAPEHTVAPAPAPAACSDPVLAPDPAPEAVEVDEPVFANHDLSYDEVASLSDNLANFVAKGDQVDDDDGFEPWADAPVVVDDHDDVLDPVESYEFADVPPPGPAPVVEPTPEPVQAEGDADDFLAQLTNLSPKAAAAIEATAEEAAGRVPAEPTTVDAAPTEDAAPEGDEEINRNLLLKFLSSTKN